MSKFNFDKMKQFDEVKVVIVKRESRYGYTRKTIPAQIEYVLREKVKIKGYGWFNKKTKRSLTAENLCFAKD